MTELSVHHVSDLRKALDDNTSEFEQAVRWGEELARMLLDGGRILVCGNGGSAAEAEHLSAELVGKYDRDRTPFSAIALTSDRCAGTAIANDYGAEEMFARQVRAHGRPGDVLLSLSTSGRSPNVLEATKAALDVGMTAWALTGPEPNPLAAMSTAAIAIQAPRVCTIQEIHLAIIHTMCESFDAYVGVAR
jgi:D-sedoheptulose 7-phosphate isomerase